MESIEVGCPVIAYDVRYGPGEIIEHGKMAILLSQITLKHSQPIWIK